MVRQLSKVETIPELRPGDSLDRYEFHRRYCAMPTGQKFELIEGIVVMASPVFGGHRKSQFKVAGVLWDYVKATPGTEGGDNGTCYLGEFSEPQPDLILRILPEWGGRTVDDENGVPIGALELIIEVSDSSERLDLGAKKRDYQQQGSQEYLVVGLSSRRLYGFDLPNNQEIPVGPDGIYRSRVFPGLWIHAQAALEGNVPLLVETLQQGLASPGHAQFVALMETRRPQA